MGGKSATYWKDRFLEIEKASNAYGVDTFRQIELAFDSAQRNIQKEIDSWYGRYAKNNNVSIQEARRQLSTTELKEFRWDVEEYIKYGRENALNQMWMKELENASARVHINRLYALKIRTQQALEAAFDNELERIGVMARKVFTDGYYHTIYEIQKGFGIGWEIGQIDERKLKTLISKPWAADGKNFSERIWNQRTQLVNELHTQLTRTCILGKAPDEAINAIAKKFNTTKNQAGRLVMTEQAYFHSVAQKEAFNDLDVEEFEIVATLDNSTSKICQEMDGKHFPMKDYQPGVTAPPFHVWCRSVTVPWFEDNYTGERAARDDNGNTYYVPDSMTYSDWKKSMVGGGGEGLEPYNPKTEPKIDPYSFTDEQIKAIEWYVSGEGQYINQYHRGRVDSNFGELSDMEKQMSSLLDEATDRVLPEDVGKLYRSVDAKAVFGDMTDDDWYNLEQYINYGGDSFGKGAYADRIRQNAQNTLKKTNGKIITEKGFMSTSKDYDVVVNWGNFTGAERPITIEFDVLEGVKGADLKNFDIEGDEQFEVLLARNTQYKITDITSKDGMIYIKAEIIPSEVVDDVVEEVVELKHVFKKGTATTIQEALLEASKHADSVSFKGITNIDSLNEMNGTINYLYETYDLQDLREITVKANSSGNIWASANFKSLYPRSKFMNNPVEEVKGATVEWVSSRQSLLERYENTIKKWSKELGSGKFNDSAIKKSIKNCEKSIEKLKEDLKYTRCNVVYAGQEIRSVITHEYGHVIADQKIFQINKFRSGSPFSYTNGNVYYEKCKMVDDVFRKAKDNGDVYKISKYASSNSYEFFAEAFTMYDMGIEELPDYIIEMIERVIE